MGIKNFPVRAGPCPSLHCPPSLPLLDKSILFALPSTNGPLPAELKFRENTGLVEMTCGLVHASYSLSEWQAVKLTFFAPCDVMKLALHQALPSASCSILLCEV